MNKKSYYYYYNIISPWNNKRCFSIFIVNLLLLLTFPNIVFAQDTLKHSIEEVIVTAGRRPVSYDNVNRSITVIDNQQIAKAPVNAIQDILEFAGGVDLRQRGVNGTQADVAIRGGTFEQTLILIDGIKIIDPQTGHYNLNLPLSMESLERIEILKGEGSRIHGPNAFSGAINFIPKKDLTKGISIGIAGGQNGYYSGSLRGSYNLGNWGNNIAIEKLKSDGYRENTEFDIINFFYNSTLVINPGRINLFFGINEKDVGANSFYSTRFPLQADYTKTKFLAFSGNFKVDQFFITPKLYWRRNNDQFVLNKYDPDFYRNLHETDFYGGEIQVSAKSILGVTTIGGEYTGDRIESTNLGNHNRSNTGIFLEHNFSQLEKISITLSGFAYDYAMIGWRIWPGFDAGYQIANEFRIFTAIGKAFRIPTYTELYYEDPVTSGNTELKHEETVNYEIGSIYKANAIEINLSIFRKDCKNIIDYVKLTEEDKWWAQNITTTYTNGIEANFSITPDFYIINIPITRISLSYTYLDSDREASVYESRYVLDNLKHQFIINIEHSFFYDVYFNWFMRYEKRIEFDDNFMTDLKVSKQIDSFNFYSKITNLFNLYYEDIAGVPLPGRWVVGGIKFSMNISEIK